ncbi:hypothetical protein C1646_716325 [Rhizophagus diaphanus]|nr:hypothetical protein C1646_716325 [Rhizophagus diaphanus] [Rhizophagus sp. MUCL 43196]
MNVPRFILMIINLFNYLLVNPLFKYGHHHYHLRKFLNIFGQIILIDQCKFNLWKLVIKNSL